MRLFPGGVLSPPIGRGKSAFRTPDGRDDDATGASPFALKACYGRIQNLGGEEGSDRGDES